MKFSTKFAAVMVLVLAGTGVAAYGAESQQDQKALDVLNRSAAFANSLDKAIIKGETYSDAGLGAGLVVSNSNEVTIKFDRPDSMYLERFDGVNTSKVFIHKGKLTLYGTENNFYAKADVPTDVKEAMQFALDNLSLELPMAEFFFADSTLDLIKQQDEILYLTDKSRIRGVDCHQIAVRGEIVDLQLWIAEGDKPAPRQVQMTMKWEGGSPRNTAFMEWTEVDKLDPKTFEFTPPEGALEIPFVGAE